ncbi:hypothetical protein K2P47_03455 [Patescibacteria group bacterium]|nr:hypothetical protein [Patescibacteria group bacterium]
MDQISEAEFQSDMQVAVSSNTSDTQRTQSIEWQVGRSTNHDQKILHWLANLEVSDRSSQIRCQPLLRTICVSPVSTTEGLLSFYLQTYQKFKSVHVRGQVRDVLFSSQSQFLHQFKKLDESTKQRLLADMFSIDPYQSMFSLEICCVAECCDWGVLHRLLPYRESCMGESDTRTVATQWLRVWQTYCDVTDSNEKGAS